MILHRLWGLYFILAVACSFALSVSLTKYQLPPQRFQSWVRLQHEYSDAAITQIWRQPLTDLPKGADGYQMVSYQVVAADSDTQAKHDAALLLEREQYNNYVAQGLSVTGTPWQTIERSGMIFTVRGLNHSTKGARAQEAKIYTLAFAQDSFVIWLQVREAATATELSTLDNILKKSAGQALADDVANYVLMLWNSPEMAPAPTQETAAAPPATADPAPPVAQPTAPTTAPEPPATAPETPEPPQDKPVLQPAPPISPDVPRWSDAEKIIALTLPDGWTVSPKAPYQFSGPAKIFVMLYPWEPYKNEEERAKVLQIFLAGQRDVALDHFAQSDFQIDGAVGVTAHYTNYAKKTSYAYYFGKSGRLWRIDVTLPGENTPLPKVVGEMIESIRVQ